MEAHITKLCKKLASVSGVLNKLKHVLPKPVSKKIYFALAHSHLVYLTGIWGQASKKCIKQLQTLQKRCLKHACKLRQRHPTVDLFRNHCPNILNVNSLYKLNACEYMHNAIPGRSYNTVIFKKKSHMFYTRNRKPLHCSATRTKIGSGALTIIGSVLYNSLPAEVTA